MTTERIDRRSYPVTLRASTAKPGRLVGHAALFNCLSENLGGFRERILAGAFKEAIRASDVRALFNHDANLVLGRTKSGTLRVSEDGRGLAIEIDPPKTSYANDLMESIERGDIDQMSFAFTVKQDRWFTDPSGQQIREIIEVDRLFDVSPVTYPAYAETSVSARTLALEQRRRRSGDEPDQQHRRRERRLCYLERSARLGR